MYKNKINKQNYKALKSEKTIFLPYLCTMKQRDKQILHIALPSIVSNITVPLLGLIDVAITGHLGSSAYIGAIAVGGMLFNIIYWMFAFLRMGTSGMTAQARGRRDFAEVTRLLMRSLGIAISISIVLIGLTPLVREGALAFIAPSADVTDLARTYFNICIFGAPASLGLFALNGWFIGMQNSRTPMIIAISQNITNIAVSLCLVYGLGMKVEGIALGTVIAQWGGFITALLLLYRFYSRLWKNGMPAQVWNRKDILKFFNVNKDIFLRTLCLISVHFFFISAGAKQGDTELAVNTLLMQMFTLYSYFMDGFAFAGEALAGKAIGARQRETYDDVVKRLFVWGAAMAGLFTLLYIVGGEWFVGILTDDASLTDAISTYQAWTILFPICGMAAFIWDGIYIGATATRYMLLSMATGMVVFFILYFTLIPVLHNHGLWIAFIGYLSVRGVMQTITRKEAYPNPSRIGKKPTPTPPEGKGFVDSGANGVKNGKLKIGNEMMLYKYNSTDNITVFSTTRHGGVSTGNYESFNANHYCGDEPEHVKANRKLLCERLGIDEARLIVPHQTHDTKTCIIDEAFLSLPLEQQKELIEGIDAVSTNIPGVCVCVSTADCIPVLIYDAMHKVVSAVHAGWRGTVARIVEENLKVLAQTYGTDPHDCKAVIGPGISFEAFEVGDEVYEAFCDAGFDMGIIAAELPTTDASFKRKTKWHINLPLCNRLQLINMGIAEENIVSSNICTYNNADHFFSARRLGIKSGRILNGITIKELKVKS